MERPAWLRREPKMVFTSRAIATRNGADDQLVYRVGIAVFDTKDPRKLILRTDGLMFVPEENWEKVGQVPNVVFAEGMVRQGARYLVYYAGLTSRSV